VSEEDLVCPECGGPIGQTSTYCLHCSADLTEYRASQSEADASVAVSSESVDGGAFDAQDAEPEATDVEEADHEDLEDLPEEMTTSPSGMDGGHLYEPGFTRDLLWTLGSLAAGVLVGAGVAVLASVAAGGLLSLLLGTFGWLVSTWGLLRWRPV